MNAYYNEIDPYAAQWLRNLIARNLIAPGDVDERSIADVRADDLRGYTQCHFFAGIGGWSVALRLAGWPDDRPVWTGSCPCQPFSSAGAGKAADDSRHLWPAWFPLIAECRPATVFGEQVEAAIGWGWLDAVFADLEGEGYACGAAVLPACSVGASHIRQRLWFVADSALDGWGQERADHGRLVARDRAQGLSAGFEPSGGACLMAHPNGRNPSPEGLQRGGEYGQREEDGGACELGIPDRLQPEQPARRRPAPGQAQSGRPCGELAGSSPAGELADAENQRFNGSGDAWDWRNGFANGCHGGSGNADAGVITSGRDSTSRIARATTDFWSPCDWLPCTDGKARPVEPGSFPLAHGVQRRASKLCAYGNAIVPQVAAAFIGAVTND